MSDGLNPAQARRGHHPHWAAVGAGGRGQRQDAGRDLSNRRADPARHAAQPHPGRHVHQQGGQAKCSSGLPLCWANSTEEKPEISTFHSLCVRILRRHAPRLGYPAQFAIYDRGDQESVARAALREIKVADGLLRPGDLLNFISRWKMQSIRPQQAASLAKSDKEHLASMAYRRYQNALKQAGAVDFDDLLLCTEELFEKFADVRRAEAERFSHLLIDEYQDTNGSQYRIVKALADGHRNLCVVGDDDQSIYGWRGADVSHILRFKHDWPDAKVVRLEENYRSTAAILTLANRLIRFNRQRHDKVLRPARPGGEKPQILQCQDETAEAAQVVDDIRSRLAGRRRGAARFRDPVSHQRTAARLRDGTAQGQAAVRADRRNVVLRSQGSPRHPGLFEAVGFARRRSLAAADHQYAAARHRPQSGRSAASTKRSPRASRCGTYCLAPATFPRCPPRRAKPIERFRSTIEHFRQRLGDESLLEVVSTLIHQIGYHDDLVRQYKDPPEQQARWAAVEEVVNTLGSYEKRSKRPTLAGFLDEIAMGDRENEQDKEEQLSRNAVALMTLHSAKGLEFPQVYLVGMEEGLLPHRRSRGDGRRGDRRGAAAVLRRHHAGPRPTDDFAGTDPDQMGQAAPDRAEPVFVRDHRPGGHCEAPRRPPRFSQSQPRASEVGQPATRRATLSAKTLKLNAQATLGTPFRMPPTTVVGVAKHQEVSLECCPTVLRNGGPYSPLTNRAAPTVSPHRAMTLYPPPCGIIADGPPNGFLGLKTHGTRESTRMSPNACAKV